MPLIYLNNQFIDENDASVSITDRGLRFGDGLFETMSFYNKTIYQLDEHKTRFKNGLSALKFDDRVNVDEIFENAESLIHMNNLNEGLLKMVITRGDRSMGYLPAPDYTPTIIIHVVKKPKRYTESWKLWLSEWIKPAANMVPIAAKTLQGMNSTLSKLEAKENGHNEGLLLNASGHIAECSGSNIFWFKGETLYTPSLACGILPGTLRDAIIRTSIYEVKQGEYTLEDLESADEIFCSNTNLLAHPVTHISSVDRTWNTHDKTSQVVELLQKDIAQQCNL
jgi:branched-subunit amino acid aminotransferase/4-amino-4-deoxychorismate lyase